MGSAADEEHSEAVVVGVAEPSGDAAVEFDEPVDGFGSAVVGAAGGEVAQERVAPLVQGAAEAGDLGDRAGVECVDDLLGDPPPLGEVLLLVGGTQLLGALPCDEHLVVRGISLNRGYQPGALLVGEVLGPGAEDGLDPVERVALAAAVLAASAMLPETDARG